MVTRLTEHFDVIKPLYRGAPRLGLALGPVPARAGPAYMRSESNYFVSQKMSGRIRLGDTGLLVLSNALDAFKKAESTYVPLFTPAWSNDF